MAALSKDDKVLLFNYLLDYEHNIALNAGLYNFDDVAFQQFLKSNKIVLCSYCPKNINNIHLYCNYFVFKQNKNIISGADKIHHLMRHIRNSVAHGLIAKKKKCYVLTDKNKNKVENMIGKIRVDLLPSLIDELKKAKQS